MSVDQIVAIIDHGSSRSEEVLEQLLLEVAKGRRIWLRAQGQECVVRVDEDESVGIRRRRQELRSLCEAAASALCEEDPHRRPDSPMFGGVGRLSRAGAQISVAHNNAGNYVWMELRRLGHE